METGRTRDTFNAVLLAFVIKVNRRNRCNSICFFFLRFMERNFRSRVLNITNLVVPSSFWPFYSAKWRENKKLSLNCVKLYRSITSLLVQRIPSLRNCKIRRIHASISQFHINLIFIQILVDGFLKIVPLIDLTAPYRLIDN